MEHMEHVNVHNACDMNVRHVTFVFTSFPNCYTEATALTRGRAVVIFFTCSNAWFCLLLIRSYQVSFRNKAYYAYHDWYHDWNSGIDWKKFSFQSRPHPGARNRAAMLSGLFALWPPGKFLSSRSKAHLQRIHPDQCVMHNATKRNKGKWQMDSQHTSITLMTLLLCAPDCSVHALWPPSALCRSYPRVHSTWQERYGKISTFGCFPVAPPLALVPLWATLGCEPGREGLPDHDDQVLSAFSHAFSHPKKVTKR